MPILRAKTIDLFTYEGLTANQQKNRKNNLTEIKDENLKLTSSPRRLVLELTNACNLNCIMCGRDENKFSYNYFDLHHMERLRHILEYTIEEVALFGWGEPTIHPKFREILEFVNGFPVRKYFVTNGTTLHKIREYLFQYKVDIMAVSLDGATAKTNNKIRTSSSFDQIVSALRNIVQQKKEKKLKYPYINFVFTLMRSNLYELPDMVNLAYDIGIEEVKAVYLTAFSEKLKDEVFWNRAKEVKKVFGETMKRSNKLGINVKLPYIQGEDIAGNKFHKDCYVGWRDFFIGADGYVRPCQSISRKMFHISKYTSFQEAWNSDEMIHFRSVVNDHEKMWEECKRCYQSSHANWNRKTSFLQVGQKFAPDWEGRK
ncbi:MAG: Radical SAM domain protein [Parcubacteria group bacterium GW2011_GWC2_39_14]|nr:MAG: Radical SAM domain protein [Parcubacteria group bacterium GW2011_GWC2_39_14]